MTRLRPDHREASERKARTPRVLTTYNEVDIDRDHGLRTNTKTCSEKSTGVKLGFMSFFTKACIHALNEAPK